MFAAGFQPLTWLKARVMPDAGDSETEWDDKLALVGLGTARAFEGLTGRKLDREEATIDEFSGRSRTWTLRRYPVEEITAIDLVDRDGSTAGLDTSDLYLMARSGVVEFPYFIGARDQRVRFTYTGGFWLDPQDGTLQPAGSTALPADVLEAWVAQVQHVAEVRGVFGDVAMRREGTTSDLELLPEVRSILRPYRRFGGE